MSGYGYDEEQPTDEEVIDEFLGENPRARELRLMRAALQQRMAVFQKERDKTQDEREKTTLSNKIRDLEKQIEALRREEAITEFVENSVRVTLTKSALDEE